MGLDVDGIRGPEDFAGHVQRAGLQGFRAGFALGFRTLGFSASFSGVLCRSCSCWLLVASCCHVQLVESCPPSFSQGVTLTILNEVFDGTTGFSISAAFFTDGSDDFFGILNQDGETGLFSGGPGVVPASAFPGTQTGVVGSDFQVSGFDNAYLVA